MSAPYLPVSPETRRILIWGKTYPELSDKYFETVCTGGCFDDGSPVRLYPVPLRYLGEISQYSLYNWIEVPVVRSGSDRRLESYRVVGDIKNEHIIKKIGHIDTKQGWARRRQVVFQNQDWHYECLSVLKARERVDRSSLGFVPVGRIEKVELKVRSAEDLQKHNIKIEKLTGLAKQSDLFTQRSVELLDLEFQPYRVYIHWKCRCAGPDGQPNPDACPGHSGSVLDWGLGELGRRKGWDKAKQKMEELSDLARYELALFVGNIKNHPTSFIVVGLWYPVRAHVPAPSLFD